MNIFDYLKQATLLLSNSDTARLDIELLLAHLLNVSRTYLLTYPEQLISAEQKHSLDQLISQRQQGYPIAYLLKKRDFWNLTLTVNDQVLIPRPETELLVQLALEKIKGIKNPRILDLGTGSGAIACAIAQERSDAFIIAIDREESAIQVAVENAQRYQLNNIHYIVSHWCDGLVINSELEKFHLILSNPPYIKSTDDHLQQGDVRFEPRSALISGEDGLVDIRKIIQQAPSYLRPNGALLLEHGYDQASAVRDLLANNHYQEITSDCDLAGVERVTMGVCCG